MPLQKLSGVATFAFLQECGFSRTYTVTLHRENLQTDRPKLGLCSTSSNTIIWFGTLWMKLWLTMPTHHMCSITYLCYR